MKVNKGVSITVRIDDSRSLQIEEEIDLEVSSAEITQALLSDDAGGSKAITRAISNLWSVCRGFTTEQIEGLNASVRKTIHNALTEQATRFAPKE